jgi:hypothetical protein
VLPGNRRHRRRRRRHLRATEFHWAPKRSWWLWFWR